MTFTERYTWAGLILSIATFAAYWIVVVIRAASDVLPFAEVAWQGPMLWALILGGGLYALAMLVLWKRVRGEARTDARDHEIERYAATAGNGITGSPCWRRLPCCPWPRRFSGLPRCCSPDPSSAPS